MNTLQHCNMLCPGTKKAVLHHSSSDPALDSIGCSFLIFSSGSTAPMVFQCLDPFITSLFRAVKVGLSSPRSSPRWPSRRSFSIISRGLFPPPSSTSRASGPSVSKKRNTPSMISLLFLGDFPASARSDTASDREKQRQCSGVRPRSSFSTRADGFLSAISRRRVAQPGMSFPTPPVSPRILATRCAGSRPAVSGLRTASGCASNRSLEMRR
mmetsp:Transcript_56294/g.168542  ORF Transcript_56294/g.168542 Transcript_56294/m.168542 type:complete len:212 (-) Transcript_56294:795-1430(-)